MNHSVELKSDWTIHLWIGLLGQSNRFNNSLYQWSNESFSHASTSLNLSSGHVRIKTSQERLSNNILRAWVLKELTCWKILKLNLDWKEHLHRIEPITTSIFHRNQFDTKSNSFPVVSMNFSSGILKGDTASKVHTIQRESQPSHTPIYCTDPKTMVRNTPLGQKVFKFFDSPRVTIAALNFIPS